MPSFNDRSSLHFSHIMTQSGSTPLETAVWGGDIETVKKLLEFGENDNYLNKVNNNMPF